MRKLLPTLGFAIFLALQSSNIYASKAGPYIGAALGESQISNVERTTGLTGRLVAGWKLNSYLGIESGYNNYADSNYKYDTPGFYASSSYSSTYSFSIRSIDLALKAYLPINEVFDLYVLGGGAYVESTREYESTAWGSEHKLNTTKKLLSKVGIGAKIQFNDSFSASLEATQIKGTGTPWSDTDAIPDIEMLALGVAYSF